METRFRDSPTVLIDAEYQLSWVGSYRGDRGSFTILRIRDVLPTPVAPNTNTFADLFADIASHCLADGGFLQVSTSSRVSQ